LDKSGFLAGFAVGLILLGIVLLAFSYWAYQLRVEYEKQAWQMYRATHSQAYQDVINGLKKISDFLNQTMAYLSPITPRSLIQKGMEYMEKIDMWISELEQVQKATEKTLEISYLEGALQSTAFLTIIIGIIILAATIAYTKLRKK